MKIPNKRELQQIPSNHSSDIEFNDFMKLYKDYTKEPFSFLLKDTTLPSDNPLTVSEKIKPIKNKIVQNKAPYNLDRQTAKSSILSSGNVDKYEFLTGEEVLPEKGLLEKAATIKRFEYPSLGSELQKQTDIVENQHQGLDKVF